LVEKSRLAPKDLRPNKGWGSVYAARLLDGVRKGSGLALVGEVEGVSAGFILGGPDHLEPWMLRAHPFTRPCGVEELYVIPRFRRTRVGAHLLSEFERQMARKGCDWARVFYHRGQRFEEQLYKRAGYVVNVVGTVAGLGRSHSPRRNRGSPVRLRPYSRRDRRVLERALEDLLVEKAGVAPAQDILPSKKWARPYATFLLNWMRKARGAAILAEIDGEVAGFTFVVRAPIPKWELRSVHSEDRVSSRRSMFDLGSVKAE
jgi:GNAT superfamily N-acetyltransferase